MEPRPWRNSGSSETEVGLGANVSPLLGALQEHPRVTALSTLWSPASQACPCWREPQQNFWVLASKLHKTVPVQMCSNGVSGEQQLTQSQCKWRQSTSDAEEGILDFYHSYFSGILMLTF